MSPLVVPQEHKIQLEVFEGPLDLLLYLIKKNELDIYDIPISLVTDQYMEYLNLMRMLDLNIAGEFIVMASTLMLIKSRMLLPVEARDELEPEEEDPRWDLVRQLIEYRKFKEAASFLQVRELEQEHIFALGSEGPVPVKLEPDTLALQDVSLFDLISAFNDALKQVGDEPFTDILAQAFTVGDKIEVVLAAVKNDASVSFVTLLRSLSTRQEIVCTFLAVLELIRLCQITVTQKGPFGEILISKAQA